MKRALTAAVLSVGLIVGLASAARAGDQGPLRLELFQIGLGSLAGWIRGAGEPKQKGDEGQFGLYLQKNTKTANFSSAGGGLHRERPQDCGGFAHSRVRYPGCRRLRLRKFRPCKNRDRCERVLRSE